MKLTPFAKFFVTIVILAVLGYVGYTKFGGQMKEWATEKPQGSGTTPAAGKSDVSKSDFDNLKNAPPDPDRKAAVGNVQTATVAGGKLSRPLVVGINTWAGHAPGIVYNRGMDPNGKSLYKSKFGLDVKFVLLEDPAAKLA